MKLNSQQKIQLAGAIVLLLCLLPMPYGYFIIVRVITMIISLYLALYYFSKNKTELVITFTIIATLFQPFFKLPLGRDVWLYVDIVVAALLIVLALKKK